MISRVMRSKAGKTLQISLSLEEDGRIGKVIIAGDFIAIPSSAIDRLEESLVNAREEDIDRKVREGLEGVYLVGVTEDDIISLISELISSLRSSGLQHSQL